MNLQEQLKAAMDKLAAAKQAVEEGIDGAVEDMTAAMEEVKGIQARIKAAEDGAALLKSFRPTEGKAEADMAEAPAKSIGEHLVKSAKGTPLKNAKGIVSFVAPTYEAKSASAMTIPSSYGDAVSTVKPDVIEGYRIPMSVTDLFAVEPVTVGNTVTYYVESSTVQGGIAAVAEGGTKPMVSFGDPTEVNATLKKIAGHYKVSDELLDDAPRLAAAIDRRAVYQHDYVEQNMLLNGDGTSGAMTGILNVSGIQTQTYASALGFDDLLTAIAAIENNTGFNADAIVLNPADYVALLKLKDSNNQYLAGGPVTGAYGNALPGAKPPIWGVPVVACAQIAQGTALVGAFKQGATLYRKGGTTVAVFNQNEDDAIKNLVTVVVESRETLAVEYPAAFVAITAASATTTTTGA